MEEFRTKPQQVLNSGEDTASTEEGAAAKSRWTSLHPTIVYVVFYLAGLASFPLATKTGIVRGYIGKLTNTIGLSSCVERSSTPSRNETSDYLELVAQYAGDSDASDSDEGHADDWAYPGGGNETGTDKELEILSNDVLMTESKDHESCWEVNRIDFEVDCYHQEPLLYPQGYPISRDMLERSIPYKGSSYLLHEAFRKANERGVLNVVIIGGSMTAGHSCISPGGLKGRDCAWGGRLQQWFDVNFKGVPVKVMNRGIPACSLSCHLAHITQTLPTDGVVDIVIIDTAVNDSNPQYYHSDMQNLLIDHEVFIEYVLNHMKNRPALIYVEGFVTNCDTNIAQQHRKVTERYGVPMISYRHAVWPNKKDMSGPFQLWGKPPGNKKKPNGHARGVAHPNWKVHQLFADVLVYYLQAEYAIFCRRFGGSPPRTPFYQGVLDRAKEVCIGGYRSYMGVIGESPFVPAGDGHGWALGEDVPGKPGFMAYGARTPGAQVTFEITCKAGSSAYVGYLTSYEGMGAVEVLVDGKRPLPGDHRLVLDGKILEHVSIEKYATIPLQARAQVATKGQGVTKAGGANESSLVTSYRVTFKMYEIPVGKAGHARSRRAHDPSRGDKKFKLLSFYCC